jgi:hypothetical protein
MSSRSAAAYLLGYASRRPHPDVVSVPAGVTIPPALRGYRVVRWAVRVPLEKRDELPVWSVCSLRVGARGVRAFRREPG